MTITLEIIPPVVPLPKKKLHITLTEEDVVDIKRSYSGLDCASGRTMQDIVAAVYSYFPERNLR